MNGAGIDYGRGITNIDTTTGIRYGVINQSSVLQAWCDSSEPDYGLPHCPMCGGVVVDYETERHTRFMPVTKHGCNDYACEPCKLTFDSEEVFPEEALVHTVDDGQYQASASGDDGFGIFVTRSPYYMLVRYCSPCAPGAGDLNNPDPDYGIKAYCFGPDWYEDGEAPVMYRVGDSIFKPVIVGRMKEAAHLASTDLRLYKGEFVELFPATNLPQGGWFARSFGWTHDGSIHLETGDLEEIR